jgi:hypothetical protein
MFVEARFFPVAQELRLSRIKFDSPVTSLRAFLSARPVQ